MTFGEKFRQERKKKGESQEQTAKGLGINRRMITKYENNLSYPRTREAVQRIADYFSVPVNYLLAEGDEFIFNASAQYGSRGAAQARELIEGFSGLCAGGELSDEDKDAVMKALQDIYWESKARNVKKYTPNKYKKPENDS